MLILHGENTIKSRQALVEQLGKAKQQGAVIERAPAKALTTSLLEQKLGGVSLFGQEQVLVIEELHSLPESKKKKELVSMLESTQSQVVLWEKRLLTKTMLKKFPKAEVMSFPMSTMLFKWLDQLGGKADKKKLLADMHGIFKQDSAQFCFTMLIRQVRLLISATDDGQLSGAPFIISKLRAQARLFSLDKLLKLHTKLLEIDYNQKRSASRLSLEQELDLLILWL